MSTHDAGAKSTCLQAQDRDRFIARGLASLERARLTGNVVDADELVRKLQERLDKHRAQRLESFGKA